MSARVSELAADRAARRELRDALDAVFHTLANGQMPEVPAA